jgi:putative glycosyltransferase (TIGR04372 family)
MITTLKYNIEYLANNGLIPFVKKYFTICNAVIFIIIIRVLNPLFKVRLGMVAPKHRIGHAAINPELYLCSLDQGIEKNKIFDILYFEYTNYSFNKQLIKMWKRVLPMRNISNCETFLSYAYLINKRFKGWEKYTIPFQKGWLSLITYGDPNNLLKTLPGHLEFTKEEELYGESKLKEMGLLKREFICFQNRDSKFLDSIIINNNWKYHDYRNSNIKNYLVAVEEIIKRGYRAVRMGHLVKDNLSKNNKSIIDYAINHREDFLDIYLIANSRFVIFPHSGLKHLAIVLRVPVVCVNVICYIGIYYLQNIDICVPKKLWSKESNRYLTFREIFDSDIATFTTSMLYEDNGIEVIENTSEEILDAATEMEMRLSGTWLSEDNDEELQNRFKQLALKCVLPDGTLIRDILPDGIKCKVSSQFLRNNKDLLN